MHRSGRGAARTGVRLLSSVRPRSSTPCLAAMSCPSPAASPFSDADMAEMRRLLASDAPVPAHDPSAPTRRHHAAHCFAQLDRFAGLALSGQEGFRHAQFGLNLGRLQELLGGVGGKAAWWAAFEPLVEARDWAGLRALGRSYAALLADDLQERE